MPETSTPILGVAVFGFVMLNVIGKSVAITESGLPFMKLLSIFTEIVSE